MPAPSFAPPPAEVDGLADSFPTASEPSVLPFERQGLLRRLTSTSRRRSRSTVGRPHTASHTNAHILSYAGRAESMVGKRSIFVLDSEVTGCFVELKDVTAKQVGSEGKHDVVRSAADIARQVGSEVASSFGWRSSHRRQIWKPSLRQPI